MGVLSRPLFLLPLVEANRLLLDASIRHKKSQRLSLLQTATTTTADEKTALQAVVAKLEEVRTKNTAIVREKELLWSNHKTDCEDDDARLEKTMKQLKEDITSSQAKVEAANANIAETTAETESLSTEKQKNEGDLVVMLDHRTAQNGMFEAKKKDLDAGLQACDDATAALSGIGAHADTGKRDSAYDRKDENRAFIQTSRKQVRAQVAQFLKTVEKSKAADIDTLKEIMGHATHLLKREDPPQAAEYAIGNAMGSVLKMIADLKGSLNAEKKESQEKEYAYQQAYSLLMEKLQRRNANNAKKIGENDEYVDGQTKFLGKESKKIADNQLSLGDKKTTHKDLNAACTQGAKDFVENMKALDLENQALAQAVQILSEGAIGKDGRVKGDVTDKDTDSTADILTGKEKLLDGDKESGAMGDQVGNNSEGGDEKAGSVFLQVAKKSNSVSRALAADPRIQKLTSFLAEKAKGSKVVRDTLAAVNKQLDDGNEDEVAKEEEDIKKTADEKKKAFDAKDVGQGGTVDKSTQDRIFNYIKSVVADKIMNIAVESQGQQADANNCRKHMADSVKDIADSTQRKATYDANVKTLTGTLTEDKKSLKDNQESLSLAKKTLNAFTELRIKERDQNEADIAEQDAAIEAIEKAILVLREFYASPEGTKGLSSFNGVKGKGTANPESPSDQMSAGTASASASGGEGVIATIQLVLSDVEASVAELRQTEARNAQLFEDFRPAQKNEIAQTESSIGLLKGAVADTSKDLATETKNLEEETKHLFKIKEYRRIKLDPICVDSGVAFGDRAARRKDEIKSLQEALGILDDVSPAAEPAMSE